MEGYCTPEDVRKAMQEAQIKDSGPLSQGIVEAAIDAQTDWIRRVTGRHWYDPDATDTLIPTTTLTVPEDNYDLPQSPHAGPHQIPRDRDWKFPVTEAGGYCRLKLKQRQVQSVSELLVRNGREYDDWVQDSDRVEGRGEDYYLESTPRTGYSYLYVFARMLSPAQDWNNSVIVSYDYGQDSIPGSIRRAQACFAAADLVMDDDVKTAIPNDGQLVAVETKADRLIKQGQRLLKKYRDD